MLSEYVNLGGCCFAVGNSRDANLHSVRRVMEAFRGSASCRDGSAV
jgi:hypothetical protein